jgi:precorrin-6B methylase 2
MHDFRTGMRVDDEWRGGPSGVRLGPSAKEGVMKDDMMEAADIDRIRARVGQMTETTVQLTALGLALQARMTGADLPPAVGDAVGRVVAEMGLQTAVAGAAPDALAPVLALIRAELLLGGHILTDGVGLRGWQDRDPGVMQAFGEVSLGFWQNVERLAPAHLLARLDAPGARFLDIGTGVGWLSIGMLRRWPALVAVGIEPLPGALHLARANLAAAGMTARMELREGRGEALADVAAYDLVFVPGVFIPSDALPGILRAARQALRPGGEVILAVLSPAAEQISDVAFRAAVWGGDVLGLQVASALVRSAGFSHIEAVPPSNGFVGFVMAGV